MLANLKKNVEDLVQWRRKIDEWQREMQDLEKENCNEVELSGDVKLNRVSVRPISVKEASMK